MDLKLLNDKKTSWVFRVIRWLVWLFSPKYQLEGTENLPDEPCVIVGNHSHMYGPIMGELYTPVRHYVWCAGEMMKREEVAAYAYRDFWSGKPKGTRWFYRILSHLITPLALCVFNNAHTIAVYHDTRLITTYRESIEKLKEGYSMVIFPECYDLAPKLKKVYYGKPIRFRADADIKTERRRICGELMDAITEIAVSLPEHTVIPYPNISARHYGKNIPLEVYQNEQAEEKTG